MELLNIEKYQRVTGVHICTQHSGKMKGMWSLSTAKSCNPFCKKASKNKDSVCSHCYADRVVRRFKNVEKTLRKNTSVLTKDFLTVIPRIDNLIFRFEAFGDLINEIQVINYFNICTYNPRVRFSLWTKNLGIVRSAIFKYNYKVPKNLNIIYSSPRINERVSKDNLYSFVNKVFTVYTKEYIDNNKIDINCGAKSCISCRKCYEGRGIYINEKIK